MVCSSKLLKVGHATTFNFNFNRKKYAWKKSAGVCNFSLAVLTMVF